MGEDHDAAHLSAFDFDLLREAFRKSVVEQNISESRWAEHARLLFQEFIDGEPDESMLHRIIGR